MVAIIVAFCRIHLHYGINEPMATDIGRQSCTVQKIYANTANLAIKAIGRSFTVAGKTAEFLAAFEKFQQSRSGGPSTAIWYNQSKEAMANGSKCNWVLKDKASNDGCYCHKAERGAS